MALEKIKVGDKEYNLEERDVALIKTIKELTTKIRRLTAALNR